MLCPLTKNQGLSILRAQLSEHVRLTRAELRQTSNSGSAATTDEEQLHDETSVDFIPDFDLSSLDDMWPSLWTDDLSGLYVNDTNQDTLSAYLLGLPRANN
jgi:hypothetical protein